MPLSTVLPALPPPADTDNMCKVPPHTWHSTRRKRSKSKGATPGGDGSVQRPPGYLSMAEVIERTGVTRATIHHYVALGLLPQPVKTAHNMAYYSPDCVERVRLSRALRARHVPLAQAADVLRHHGVHGTRAILERTEAAGFGLSSLVAGSGPSVSRDELLARSGLSDDDLDDLEELGLACRGDDRRYDGLTVELTDVLARLRAAGMNEEAGFRPRDMAMYRDVMSEVVDREVGYFDARLFRSIPDDQAAEIVRMALQHSEALLVIVRRRLLLEQLTHRSSS